MDQLSLDAWKTHRSHERQAFEFVYDTERHAVIGYESYTTAFERHAKHLGGVRGLDKGSIIYEPT